MFDIDKNIALDDSTVRKCIDKFVERFSDHDKFYDMAKKCQRVFKEYRPMFDLIRCDFSNALISTMKESDEIYNALILKQKTIVRKMDSERNLSEIIKLIDETVCEINGLYKTLSSEQRESLSNNLFDYSEKAKRLTEDILFEEQIAGNEEAVEKHQQSILKFLKEKNDSRLVSFNLKEKKYKIIRNKFKKRKK